LAPSNDRANGRAGQWSADEDNKLKDAVKTHGGKNWGGIAALVPNRTISQCRSRWKDILDPNIGRVTGRKGSWTAEEDSKLKDAVQTYGGKNWGVIAELVPGRTTVQCHGRWKDVLAPSNDRANGRRGEWSADEDIKLKDAVQIHGGRNWDKIAALVPGRMKNQCNSRWHDVLNPDRKGRKDVQVNGQKTKIAS
jgi:myb proto-oncogene protein